MTVQLTEKQKEASKFLGCASANVMLYGGAGSGKTFLICWRIIHNALNCHKSRQAIVRKHLNTVRTAIGLNTLPTVLEIEKRKYRYNKQESIFEFPNGSSIWLLGLDDKTRTEKVLGKEFFTMYFNECSEMSWESVQVAMTRNRMKVPADMFGNKRRNRLYFDCNPPSKRHWCYKAFVEKLNPQNNLKWKEPDNWDYCRINPQDNRENLGSKYIESLNEYTGNMRLRFLDGQFSDDNEHSLWRRSMIDPYRLLKTPCDLERIVVAVDPSGGGQPSNCEAGIIVAGMKTVGSEQHFYILDDKTLRGTPNDWASQAVRCYHEYQADCIVAETNYGGAMVESTVRAVEGGQNTAYRSVTASRSKIVRAEPVAALYQRGLVHHTGDLPLLEDELCSYTGNSDEASPNRLDALVWAVSDLMGNPVSTVTAGEYYFF
ncbi:MAG: phage terminase large subunit [Planctomycetaceae bacterium]|jgi:phage terminase large subunit-like protein|nr:phage terminase large subunit [Planctomycetaceae bacterium]